MDDEFDRTIRGLRAEMKADSLWTETVLDRLTAQVQDVSRGLVMTNAQMQVLAAQVAETSTKMERVAEGFTEVAREMRGRNRLAEDRFAKLLEAVENKMRDHDQRLDRLEQDRPPAA